MKIKRKFYQTLSEVKVLTQPSEHQPEYSFTVSGKMAEWYLGFHKIAEVVEANEYGTISIIRLLFPITAMSRCVVSGLNKRILPKKNFDQHHIVPQMYLKWFPKNTDLKQDIVYIEYKLHRQYEKKSFEFQKQIAKELGLKTFTEYQVELQAEFYSKKVDEKKQNVYSLANALARHGEKIPEERKNEMRKAVIEHFGYEPSLEFLAEAKTQLIKDITSYGKYVLDKVPDLQEFAERWRQHFLDTMKPNFMPKYWDSKKSIYIEDTKDVVYGLQTN